MGLLIKIVKSSSFFNLMFFISLHVLHCKHFTYFVCSVSVRPLPHLSHDGFNMF